jgi:hypothetical protein
LECSVMSGSNLLVLALFSHVCYFEHSGKLLR